MRLSENLCLIYRLALTEKNSAGEAPLYLRLTVAGKRSEIAPGIRLLPAHWDSNANRVKQACKQAFKFNRTLSAARALLEDIDLRLSVNGQTVTASLLKQLYEREIAAKLPEHEQQQPEETGISAVEQPTEPVPDVPAPVPQAPVVALNREVPCAPSVFELPDRLRLSPSPPPQVVVFNNPALVAISPVIVINEQPKEPLTQLPAPARRRTLMQALNWKYSKFAALVKAKQRVPNSLKRWKVTKGKLRQFLKQTIGTSDIFLDEIKLSLADDFRHFMLTKQGLKANTSGKYLKNVKELLKIAEDREWISKNKWNNYKVVYDQPDRKYLQMTEVINLYEKPLIERLDHVRNIFLFASFTGYAFEEVRNLKRTDVFVGNDGRRWIRITRKKTTSEECIPLLPIAASIVDHYWNDPDCIEKGRLLPVKSYHNYNGFLKEVGIICGVQFDLSTHVARHTFATTICLDNGVPLEVVSRMLGHKSIRTTQIYAKITTLNVSRNMSQLEKTLFTPQGMLRMDIIPVAQVVAMAPVYTPAVAV